MEKALASLFQYFVILKKELLKLSQFYLVLIKIILFFKLLSVDMFILFLRQLFNFEGILEGTRCIFNEPS